MNSLHYGLTPKMKPLSPRRAALVVALDIGTSKIACLIARLTPNPQGDALRRRSHAIEVIGFSHTGARGMKAGAVVDLVDAEEAIRHAVDIAENAAKVRVDSVVASISAGRMASELIDASMDIKGTTVTEHDMARVIGASGTRSIKPGRVLLHTVPIGFSIDDTRGVRDPRGMLAHRFGAELHMVSADLAACRNLMLAVERCHLDIEAMVASPYVAALSTLAGDEADVGAAVLDLGAGTTTMAVFSNGRFIHADGFALGGNHITQDLARGMSASLYDAERIKTLYGTVLTGGVDERDMIALPRTAGNEQEAPQFVARATLTQIIKPRVEEILEMARDRLKNSPFAADPRGRVILTGGGSLLGGMADLASQILSRSISIGRPLGISGLPDVAKSPAFAAAAGLLVYPQMAHLEYFEPRHTRRTLTGNSGYIAKVGRWLRESF
jgi:cell division protein FtsA